MRATRVLGIAGLFMASGIVVGALAAHALQTVMEPRQLDSLHTAVNYQLFNALGLLMVGMLMRGDDLPALRRVAVLLIIAWVYFAASMLRR